MVIAHNVLAMNAQRQYGIVNKNRAKSTEKLSSGYKINRAADNAAGLAISEKMRRQIRGLSRGVENTQDGVSVCQVADGALAEINDMLHRLTELSVQSANDTNSASDRNAIQKEVSQIVSEIDRISDTTKFNDVLLFKGGIAEGLVDNVQYEDPEFKFDFKDIKLRNTPLASTPDSGYYLNLGVEGKPGTAAAGKKFDLVYKGGYPGSTSRSSVAMSYLDEDSKRVMEQIDLDKFTVSDYTAESDTVSSRKLTYKDDDKNINIEIIQKAEIEDTDEKKIYRISYETKNLSDPSIDSSFDFVFNIDTAYNSDDKAEEYYATIDGKSKKMTTGVITKGEGHATCVRGYDGMKNMEDIDLSNGLSVISVKNALPFSQNINSSDADHIILGPWSQIDTIDMLKYRTLDNTLDRTILGSDKAVTMIFENAENRTFSLEYGVIDALKDDNVKDLIPKKLAGRHSSENNIWIQAGNSTWSGMHVVIDEMDTNILGIRDLDVTEEYTYSQDVEYINKVGKALEVVNAMRGKIGAQQNRLEHTIKNESNIVENTQAAESRIRDTDMADEMVRYTKNNILTQAGEAMMAQANQSKQGVLSLLQ